MFIHVSSAQLSDKPSLRYRSVFAHTTCKFPLPIVVYVEEAVVGRGGRGLLTVVFSLSVFDSILTARKRAINEQSTDGQLLLLIIFV